MSIKKSLIDKLKKDFLLCSNRYRKIMENRKELCQTLVDSIRDYSIKDIPEQDLKRLEKCSNFWITDYFYFGKSFRNRFGGIKEFDSELISKINDYDSYLLGQFYKVYVYREFFENHSEGNGHITDFPRELLVKLIDLNDKILDIDCQVMSIKNSWDRLINKDTKISWLRANFPELHKKLKEYE